MRMQEDSQTQQFSLAQASRYLALISATVLSLIATSAFAAISETEASAGAYCECNEPDAFPGISKLFSRSELQEIKQTFKETDPRKPIDRLESNGRELNAIGQIKSARGFGSGVLVGDDIILTNAHVTGPVGSKTIFNVGQTENNSQPRWMDTTEGEVIAVGGNDAEIASDTQRDWALVKIKRPLGKKFGFIEPYKFDRQEMIYASDRDKLWTAGFPGFKDPRYLWGQKGARIMYRYDDSRVRAAASAGMSGGALLWEHSPGKFMLVGLIQSRIDQSGPYATTLNTGGRLRYNSDDGAIVNFFSESFGRGFGPAFDKAIGQ